MDLDDLPAVSTSQYFASHLVMAVEIEKLGENVSSLSIHLSL